MMEARLERELSLRVDAVAPMVSPGWVCLMYHNVSCNRTGLSGERSAFDVPLAAFERQLDIIRDLGFRGCSVREAMTNPQPSRVAITFDDGDAGVYDYALSVLVARGMTATFFITTSWVGTPGFVSWNQLREMKAAGMSIQSHTHSHPFLAELSEAQIRDELEVSKDRLDQELDQETDQISLPNGDWPPRSLRYLLPACGYRVVGTSQWGSNRGTAGSVARRAPIHIRRCTVRGAPSENYFKRVVLDDHWIKVGRVFRDGVLRGVRTTLRPSRYARWRRTFLNGFTRITSSGRVGEG